MNSQNQTQQCGSVVFHSFDPVTVRLSLDSTNIQHEKLTFQLIEPFIEGFSWKTPSTEVMETEQSPPQKRQGEPEKSKPKKKKK